MISYLMSRTFFGINTRFFKMRRAEVGINTRFFKNIRYLPLRNMSD